MKFFSWLFSISTRHHRDAINYEKGKVGSRIFTIVLLLFLVGATLGVEYWSFTVYDTSAAGIIKGFFASILAIILGLVTIETCAVYSFFGFKYAMLGTLASFIQKVENKKKKNSDNSDIQKENQANVDESTIKERNVPKWLDFLVGILGLILSFGTLIAMMFVFISIIKGGIL